ncbi:MAG: hypothetical protein WD053_10915 [Gracilimonas sp.]
MTVTINKKNSIKEIRAAIQKASSKPSKKRVEIDRYFGKVNFGMDGLEYQKKVRNEWK